MFSIDAADMRNFIESLGTTIVITDIEEKHERHFVEEIKRDVEGGGLGSLVTRYVPLVTLMDRCAELQDPVRKCIVDIIIEALRSVDKVMVEVNDDVKKLDEDAFKTYQQVVAVVLYMSYKCLEEFNFCSSVRSDNISVTYSKKDKARSRSSYGGNSKEPFGFWPRQRDSLLDILSFVIQKNLYPLWERIRKPNGKTFYGLIVQGLVATVKYGAKDIMRDNFASKTVTSMFNHLIVKHNFEDDIVMHLMQNILDSEDIARSITKVILSLRALHGRVPVIRKSIQVAFELINRPENRDKWEKGFTCFLLDIGTTFPEDIADHSLPYIITLLEADSVAVRSAVLSILVEVITHVRDSGKENNSPAAIAKTVELRKQLLEHLEMFMRDANAVVRSKAVASITTLISSKGVEMGELVPLIYEAGERILDVSAAVRKNSFGVFAAIILNDPLLANQTPQQFRAKVLQTRRGLVSLRTNNIDDVLVRLRIVVKEFTEQLRITKLGLTLDSIPTIPELRDPETALEHLKALLERGDYWEACECFYKCIKTFDDVDVFRMFDLHTYEYYMNFFMREMGLNQAENEPAEIPDTFETDMLETQECKTARKFLTHMHTLEALSDFLYNKVIPIVLQLFRYGVSSDQTEVMGYLATLSDQKYPLPPQVPLAILDCISRVDKSAVSQIVEPFIVIFLSGPECKTAPGFIKTLIAMVDNLGIGRRNHMNLLIQEMVRSKRIHIQELRVLWSTVTMELPEFGENESKIALYILGICGKADRNCLESLFSKIIEVGLGPRGCNDMELAATALAAIFESLRKTENEVAHKKLPADHPLFTGIYEVIRHALVPETREQANEFFSKVADIGISLIYDCCLAPAKAISPIIIGCYKWIFGSAEGSEEQNDITQFEMTEKTMFKFLSLAGAITGSHASYHSKYVLDEVKRRKMLIALETSDARKAVKSRLRDSVAEIHRRKSVGRGKIVYSKSIDDQLLKADEEELDAVVGQVGFDKETELIRNYMDKLLDEGTFKFYWQNIIFICRRYKNLKSLRLRVAAIRLVVKLMLVGQKALSGLMDIYIGLWKEVKTTEERVELVLSAILLNDCYPNQMNTVNGLALLGLKCESPEVRQATLDFVTFLTLNDVLKLREILPDTICRLADPVEDIQEVTKLFLKECHEKDTMLHSAIPDMIIRLSAADDLTGDMFQQIMKGLLEPIKKVNEVVGIANKLLERFGGEKLNRGREAQNNAVCLSLLNYNDKFFKSVREALPQYEKYLDDDTIFECFTTILQTARDNLKPENREKLESYEEKLQDARKNASEIRRMNNANKDRNGALNKSIAPADSSSDEEMPSPDSPPAASFSGATRKSTKKPSTARENAADSSDTSDKSESDASTTPRTSPPPTPGSVRAKRESRRFTRASARLPVSTARKPARTRKVAIITSSESESESVSENSD